MNREQQDELIDLGAATIETRGGPTGMEDAERTYWMHGIGLTED